MDFVTERVLRCRGTSDERPGNRREGKALLIGGIHQSQPVCDVSDVHMFCRGWSEGRSNVGGTLVEVSRDGAPGSDRPYV